MNPISSLNNSVYSDLLMSFDAVSGRNASENYTKQSYDSSDITPTKVDLNDYYNNVPAPERDLVSQVGHNVTESARTLDNALMNALANGYTVQDVCNIKSAEAAYKANCNVFKTTFELTI